MVMLLSFLDSRGLNHLKENDLGPVYGHQWRYFKHHIQHVLKLIQPKVIDIYQYQQ